MIKKTKLKFSNGVWQKNLFEGMSVQELSNRAMKNYSAEKG